MEDNIIIRPITESDVPHLRKFVEQNKPLGLHSAYTYWMICHYFKDYSLIAETDNGLIIGIRICLKIDDILFFWQGGVAEEFRRQGLAQQLINHAIESGQKNHGIKKIQFSIDPKNTASLALYTSWCQKKNLRMNKIDSVNFVDPIESISEFEDLYEITLTDL